MNKHNRLFRFLLNTDRMTGGLPNDLLGSDPGGAQFMLCRWGVVSYHPRSHWKFPIHRFRVIQSFPVLLSDSRTWSYATSKASRTQVANKWGETSCSRFVLSSGVDTVLRQGTFLTYHKTKWGVAGRLMYTRDMCA